MPQIETASDKVAGLHYVEKDHISTRDASALCHKWCETSFARTVIYIPTSQDLQLEWTFCHSSEHPTKQNGLQKMMVLIGREAETLLMPFSACGDSFVKPHENLVWVALQSLSSQSHLTAFGCSKLAWISKEGIIPNNFTRVALAGLCHFVSESKLAQNQLLFSHSKQIKAHTHKRTRQALKTSSCTRWQKNWSLKKWHSPPWSAPGSSFG